MNVLLCSINAKYIHSSLAVWYLSESIRENCADTVDVEILESTINRPEEMVLHTICKKQPDVLAFSCYIWNISFVQKLARKIAAEMPDACIILGGPEVSYNPEEVLAENPDVDYIITGEGEIPFPQFLNALESGGDVSGIPSLCFKNSQGVPVYSPPEPSLTEPLSPYTPEYLKALGGRIAYLETSRGCPFSCAFCLSGLNGCQVRFFDIERAKKELVLLANSGTQTVKLVDRTFNCNPSRAYELFSFIIKNAGEEIPEGVCFHFEVAADLFDDKTLDLLEQAPPGLMQLEAGLQSFNTKTLKGISRKTDLVKLEKNIRTILKNQNIHLHIDLIAGLPYENLESFKDSFDRAFLLYPHMLQLGFLKMLHGSELRQKAAGLGYSYSPNPPYEVISSPWLSREDMISLRAAEYALQRLYNSGRFLFTLDYLLKATEMRPFSLLEGLGAVLARKVVPLSLDELTHEAYKYFSGLIGVHSGKLRDAIVCDRIASGQKIPDFLKIPDKEYKSICNHIKQVYFKDEKENKQNIALLYAGEKRAVFAEGLKNPVNNRYSLRFITLK